MFHWNCPECGREIAPAVKECPECDPASAAAQVQEAVQQPNTTPSGRGSEIPTQPQQAAAEAPAPVLAADTSPAKQLQEAVAQAPEPVLAADANPAQQPQEADSPILEPVQAAIIVPEPLPQEAVAEASEPLLAADADPAQQPQEAVAKAPEPVLATDTVLAEPRPQEAVAEAPEPVLAADTVLAEPRPQEAVAEAPVETAPEPDSFADRLAALAEQLRAGHIPYSRPEGTAPKVAEPPVAPLPASSPEIAPEIVRPLALLAAAPVVALLPEPAPPAVASPVPSGNSLVPRASVPTWTPTGLAAPEPFTGRVHGNLTHGVPFPSPGMGDLTDYRAVVARTIRPVPPKQKVLVVDTAPRVTLAGPILPRELTSLQAAGLGTIMADRPRASRKGIPGWIVSFLVMSGLLVAGFGAVFYTMPGILAGPRTSSKEVVAATSPAYPLARYVEVTGFRFLVDFNKKSEIHYLVVNHSNALLSGMTIFVTLHGANAKPGQPPLSRFSFPAPNLGPFESREMTSPIEHVSRPFDLPEWQDLRADVEIGQ